ncbi:hypothetical protein GCM10007925_07990 [Sphingomonas astaxanthinifaciens DSM 22298]|uniref:SMODS and SLOG-associating 2TM effector domain-containing protein n=1 Tax=Sphingomonas astaxanthinifaciens DSM 22298 TaxID=1123267 RepID=A0ABQ5Z8A8_9SPHN|nr:hypothetical protein GCM10007925_07990 [Sphingomonas astaxanthinifaciens DSM 22298]
MVERTSPIIERVFADLRAATEFLHVENRDLFSAEPPQLRLHTPLATGADQMAATVARRTGFEVRALLPLAADDYDADFKRGREKREFAQHLELAHEVFALPSEGADRNAAYVQVGRAVVASCDVLIAVWDGRDGNGPGGTAYVVDLALNLSVPVIHVPIDRDTGTPGEPRLIFGRDIIDYSARPLEGREDVTELVADVLLPRDTSERGHALEYFEEQEKTANWRIEYPLLLSLLRVKKLPKRFWHQTSIADDIAYEWKDVRDPGPEETRRPFAWSYGWANFLAIRYAQLFRSGHITNYVLSALAVNLALFGLIAPAIKIYLVMAELGVIGLLFCNTNAGTQGDWHRKWLQYRYLAETLRPFLYLKRTGLVGPPFRNEYAHAPMHRRGGADWTRWYAAAVWRQMGWPNGELTSEGIRQLATDAVTEQLLPQAAYHKVNAERMHKLDHRLHEIGNFLMGAVIAACFLYLIGYFVMHDWTKSLTGPFIFLTAGLPAIGAAVFGMRGHGEHLLAASRSAHTVEALTGNVTRLRQATQLDALARELEASAGTMLADLNEWTASYSERSLEIPA